jgi:hypothetical protein
MEATAGMVQTGTIEAKFYTVASVACTYTTALDWVASSSVPTPRDLASWSALTHGSNGPVLNGTPFKPMGEGEGDAPLADTSILVFESSLTGARMDLIWRGGSLQQKACRRYYSH